MQVRHAPSLYPTWIAWNSKMMDKPRDLGLNESLPIRFSQKIIQENDLLLLAPIAPESWVQMFQRSEYPVN